MSERLRQMLAEANARMDAAQEGLTPHDNPDGLQGFGLYTGQ